jgi:hypothetical protein
MGYSQSISKQVIGTAGKTESKFYLKVSRITTNGLFNLLTKFTQIKSPI